MQLYAVTVNYFLIKFTAQYTNLSENMESLIKAKLEYVLSHKELHNFAVQIARGMKHLEEKHITHR